MKRVRAQLSEDVLTELFKLQSKNQKSINSLVNRLLREKLNIKYSEVNPENANYRNYD